MSPHPVRIAVQYQPQHAAYDDIRRAVARGEEMGIDIAYNWDHFYPLYGDRDGAHFECWTMLGAWAEATEHIEIGALVTCNSYRNPQLLADMARTVDHMSGGRLIFGIGSGWFERDYDEYDYEFGTAGSRLRDLRANMPVIKERWAKLNPAPTRDIPVLIGGGGEKVTLRIVAEHADIWHGFGNVETIAHKLGVLRGHCEAVGRDFDEIEKSVGIDWERSGEPGDIGERFLELGVTQFTLGTDGPDFDVPVLKSWIDWRDEKNAG